MRTEKNRYKRKKPSTFNYFKFLISVKKTLLFLKKIENKTQ